MTKKATNAAVEAAPEVKKTRTSITAFGPKSTRDWDSVDWNTEYDIDISRRLNCSRERVRQMRNALNQPRLPRRRVGANARSVQGKVLQAKDSINQQSRVEAAKSLGIAPSTLDKYRRLLKIEIADGRYKLNYKLWNFELPNTDLERIWKLRRNTAANTRSRLRRGSPSWNVQRGSTPQDPAYDKTVKAEERKAEKYFTLQQEREDLATAEAARVAAENAPTKVVKAKTRKKITSKAG